MKVSPRSIVGYAYRLTKLPALGGDTPSLLRRPGVMGSRSSRPRLAPEPVFTDGARLGREHATPRWALGYPEDAPSRAEPPGYHGRRVEARQVDEKRSSFSGTRAGPIARSLDRGRRDRQGARLGNHEDDALRLPRSAASSPWACLLAVQQGTADPVVHAQSPAFIDAMVTVGGDGGTVQRREASCYRGRGEPAVCSGTVRTMLPVRGGPWLEAHLEGKAREAVCVPCLTRPRSSLLRPSLAIHLHQLSGRFQSGLAIPRAHPPSLLAPRHRSPPSPGCTTPSSSASSLGEMFSGRDSRDSTCGVEDDVRSPFEFTGTRGIAWPSRNEAEGGKA